MHHRSICKLLLRHDRLSSLSSLNSSAHGIFHSTPFPKPTTNFHRTLPNSRTQFITRRHFSGSGDFDRNKEVDMINLKFAEAREEIEMAMESKETVYFDEEAECARIAVNQVLDSYAALLAKLPEDKRAALQRSMGLKIEQLKAEIEQLNE
ncbi:embryogenesis-like protein [Argentina anserina]|uniref:embryogenesis-like protein n=1 Tax=Argentina anserina TaxID=57926 RepID=UPI002176276C|nr:embryogenesis-like protein [Potentilla anserina]